MMPIASHRKVEESVLVKCSPGVPTEPLRPACKASSITRKSMQDEDVESGVSQLVKESPYTAYL
jgi:hypothetical protein